MRHIEKLENAVRDRDYSDLYSYLGVRMDVKFFLKAISEGQRKQGDTPGTRPAQAAWMI